MRYKSVGEYKDAKLRYLFREGTSGQLILSKLDQTIKDARREKDPNKLADKINRCHELVRQLAEDINIAAAINEEMGAEIAVRILAAHNSLDPKDTSMSMRHLDSALMKVLTFKARTGVEI